MTLTLAFRNLFHDRVRLAVTLIGILFSIVLVAVQLGPVSRRQQDDHSMIDRADGDIWIMAYGTKNFEEAQPIDSRAAIHGTGDTRRRRGDAAGGSFTDWKKPHGRLDHWSLIGADPEDGGLRAVEHRRRRSLGPRRA